MHHSVILEMTGTSPRADVAERAKKDGATTISETRTTTTREQQSAKGTRALTARRASGKTPPLALVSFGGTMIEQDTTELQSTAELQRLANGTWSALTLLCQVAILIFIATVVRRQRADLPVVPKKRRRRLVFSFSATAHPRRPENHLRRTQAPFLFFADPSPSLHVVDERGRGAPALDLEYEAGCEAPSAEACAFEAVDGVGAEASCGAQPKKASPANHVVLNRTLIRALCVVSHAAQSEFDSSGDVT